MITVFFVIVCVIGGVQVISGLLMIVWSLIEIIRALFSGD